MEVLKLHELKKSFGGVKALDNISTVLNEGEVIMVIGPNGAGKTTLVNVISGYLYPDEGRIIYMDEDITRIPPLERVSRGIVRSFQLVNTFNRLTVYENILISTLSNKKYQYKLTKTLDNYTDALEEAENILKLFGLSEKADENIMNISYGDRKLVDIAISFALNPKLIMLDEPTSGVATKDKDSIIEKILDVIRRTKVTSIIIEHDMDIVFRYGKRITVMHQGKIIADGEVEEIRKNEEVRKVLLGGIYA
ncbi:MAG: ABC transporter ATP-binding protein [Nitrososphaeria archaeon]|nr:ABC transporter ATP-binding protein [Nitrososphaeria archaeon]